MRYLSRFLSFWTFLIFPFLCLQMAEARRKGEEGKLLETRITELAQARAAGARCTGSPARPPPCLRLRH